MNLKYYLRGLGIGIIVTALIMGIAAGGKKETLSDSEIKERARALGMTEETTLLADAVSTGSPEAEETPAPTGKPTVTPEPTIEPSATPTPTEEPLATPTPTEDGEPSAVPTPAAESIDVPETAPEITEESTQETGSIMIQVDSGDGSYTVCRKLEEAGLIISASDFDRYLYENGYDKRINVGTFEIPENADPQLIARILAGLE